jgi:hypothetical protein
MGRRAACPENRCRKAQTVMGRPCCQGVPILWRGFPFFQPIPIAAPSLRPRRPSGSGRTSAGRPANTYLRLGLSITFVM